MAACRTRAVLPRTLSIRSTTAIRLLILAFSLVPATARGQDAPSAMLWYRQPAERWSAALPVGNGRIGAMVLGGVNRERIQLNDATLWSGNQADHVNPQGPRNLGEIRRLLQIGRPLSAEQLAARTLIDPRSRLGSYLSLGDLILDLPTSGEVTDYRRILDLDQGMVRVEYRVGGDRYFREIFASYPDQSLVVRVGCDRAGRISLAASLTRPREARASVVDPQNLRLQGRCDGGQGMAYQASLRLVNEGGTVRAEGERIRVEGANAVTLLLCTATTFRVSDPAEACATEVQHASAKPYNAIRAAHLADHRRLYRRMELGLRGSPDAASTSDPGSLPTDERVARVAAGQSDPDLEALYFQLGRYLLIASSRPGGPPPTRTGLWSEAIEPGTGAAYELDGPTSMGYWPVETTNLAELHEPLFDLLDRLRFTGRKVARSLYGSSGFVAHQATDLWGHAAPIGPIDRSAWPMGGVWLTRHLWEHYEFGGDRRFLADRVYPALKEAVEFFLEHPIEDDRGQLLSGPSVSPGSSYRLPEGQTASICLSPSSDVQLLGELVDRCIEASFILGTDRAFRTKLIGIRPRIPGPSVNEAGRLMEWPEDLVEAAPGSPHLTHLFGLYPGLCLTPQVSPRLAAAARLSFERRLEHGSGQVPWSAGWAACLWSRLGESERAHATLVRLLHTAGMPGLPGRDGSIPLDATLAGVAAMAELLLQSHGGELSLLPALPAAWSSGRVKGLRARQGLEVDLVWRDGRLTGAKLVTARPGTHRVRAPEGVLIDEIRCGGEVLNPGEAAANSRIIDVDAGKIYELTFR